MVCDPHPRTSEGKNRKEQLEKLGIKVSNKMPPLAKYVFVGGALTELARYLINHKIESLVMNGGFVGCNIVRNPLDKFKDKNVILVGKNVCHSEKNTLLGVWRGEKELLEKYHSKPGKRQHDMLACREGLIMLGMLDEESYLDYKIVRPYNTGLKERMTEWGSTFGKSSYRSVLAAVGWR